MAHESEPGIREDLPATSPVPAHETPIRLPGGESVQATDAALSMPMTPDGPPRWLDPADQVFAVLVVVLSFLLGSYAASNSDLWMQFATGRLLSEGTFTFGVDPFSVATEASHDEPARVWVHHSWLTSWLLYQGYQTLGGSLLVVLKALVFAGTIALLFGIRLADTNRWLQVMCLLLAALAISPRLLLQPIVLSFLLLAVTLYVLHRAGMFRPLGSEDAWPRVLWLLPPLFLLWANLDNWFVLGPLALGVCAVAMGVLRLLKLPRPLPGSTLALVFGASLLACLVNPFHVRVFQLPPELAFVLLRVTDVIGLPMPEFLVAGGRTIQQLMIAEPNLALGMSPFAPGYFQNLHLGMNIAGVSYYLLLGLGLAGFLLQAVLGGKAGFAVLQPSRFGLWLVFGLMGGMNFRLIPFFALVAGPLTALTLSECFLGLEARQASSLAARRWVMAQLARGLTVPLLLFLFFLAWPGWINGPTSDLQALHRVAWEIPIDPSLQRAALRLDELHREDKVHAVFNFSAEIANYCAYFAPGVKTYMDYRYNLFPEAARVSAKAQQALIDKSKPASAWEKVFREHKIDGVVLNNFASLPANQSWWQESKRWTLQYGDNKTVVFSWSTPAHPWPSDTVERRWHALAFGPENTVLRAPRDGSVPPLEGYAFWHTYLGGQPPQPLASNDVYLKYSYFDFASRSLPFTVEAGSLVADVTSVVSAGSISGVTPGLPLPALTGPLFGMHVKSLVRLQVPRNPNAIPLVRGPASVPLLMVRLARQAVAENPHDAPSYAALADAYRVLWQQQEDSWDNAEGTTPNSLRARLRQIQILTALRNATLVRPDDPLLHMKLAETYVQQQNLDLALDHLKQAQSAFETVRLTGKQRNEELLKARDELKKRVDMVTVEVERRQRDYEREALKYQGMEKVRFLTQAPYRTLNKENKEQYDPRGFGLPGLALKILETMPDASLKEEDRIDRLRTILYLTLTTGRAAEVAPLMPELRDKLGPLFHELNFYLNGALGNYSALQESLGAIASTWTTKTRSEAVLAASMLTPTAELTFPLLLGRLHPSLSMIATNQISLAQDLDFRTLLALNALEAGDTAAARTQLRAIVREAEGRVEFNDAPIARRYLRLLEQRP